MNIRTGVLEDKKALYDLDKRYYTEEWLVPDDYVDKVLLRNPSVYRIAEDDGEIVGYYGLFPFAPEVFDRILNGTLSEKDMIDCIVSYEEPRDICLYVVSFIVNQDLKLSNYYAVGLLRDLTTIMNDLKRTEMNVLEVGAIAVTTAGEMFCQRLGLKETKIVDHAKVYRLELEDY